MCVRGCHKPQIPVLPLRLYMGMCMCTQVCQSSTYGVNIYTSFGKTSTASWSVADDGNVTTNYYAG